MNGKEVAAQLKREHEIFPAKLAPVISGC